jgi:hypothetical protein
MGCSSAGLVKALHPAMIWRPITKQLACDPGRHVIVSDRQSKLMVAVRASKSANLGTATRHWHDRDQVHFHTTTAVG